MTRIVKTNSAAAEPMVRPGCASAHVIASGYLRSAQPFSARAPRTNGLNSKAKVRDSQPYARPSAAETAASARSNRFGARSCRAAAAASARLDVPAASIGTSVSATTSENASANVTVSDWSLKSWPATPVMNTIGKNTATDVSVAAVTAMATSAVPRRAASCRSSPCSWRRTMLSSTTTALSTSMPTASAMPPSDMMFSERLNAYISTNVPSTDTGMAMPAISVVRASRRNA